MLLSEEFYNRFSNPIVLRRLLLTQNMQNMQNMQTDRGAPFTPVTGRCNLCTKEKFYILRKPEMASLNSRQEVGNHCRHIAMSLLSNVGKVKVPG